MARWSFSSHKWFGGRAAAQKLVICFFQISEMAFHTCDEIQAFKEAFDAFDWNKSGTISYKSLQVSFEVDHLKHVCIMCPPHFCHFEFEKL